jgi:citronellol/citronellal dehydrogenase
MRFEGRVALITGASRGIGACIAKTLAREGCRIVAAGKTMEPNAKLAGTLHDTVRMVEEAGSEAIAVGCDVRDEEQVEAAVRAGISRFGRIDYLLNNAGAIFWAPVEHWPTKKFDLVFSVNVRAAFLCSRAVLPIMRAQGYGHIVMMSPPEVPQAAPGKGPYLVSKLGMTMLGRAIDAENADAGVCASALWPVTAIRTAATENFSMGEPSQWREPEVLADATAALLAMDPRTTRFRAWLDEDVLAAAGVTDLSGYSTVPGNDPPPLSIQLVDPDWTRDGRRATDDEARGFAPRRH